jgi:hypothetical protein
MPIQFITGSFKSVIVERREDVRRLLHVAFDNGYLFEAYEIEAVWGQLNKGWAPLPSDDKEIWKILQKSLPAELAGAQHPDFKPG